MTEAFPGSNGRKARIMAAVMAAVQAYLEEEAYSAGPRATGPISAWKMAARTQARNEPLVRPLSWTGRD